MKNGNWVPISKSFLKHLPHDRAYTKMEAIYSMQCDYDDNRPVSVTGYSKLWRWSKNKVWRFFDDVGVRISYPEDTQKRQNQKGLIAILIRDRSWTDKGLIRFIDNKDLPRDKDRYRTDEGLMRDRSGNTTIDTDTKTETKTKDIVYPDWLDKTLWKEYLKYRTKIKKPMTDHAEQLSLTALIKLVDAGDDQEAVINKTINSGKWTTFYPIKTNEQNMEPKTYAQAQDMERRQIARALLEDRENEQGDNQEGTRKVSGLLSSS